MIETLTLIFQNFLESLLSLISYGFMQRALLGALCIGLVSGLLAPFLVIRRLSLVGDGIAHLAFGGIAVGLLFGINPYISALGFAILGGLFVRKLVSKQIYGEAAIALILSFGVGLGIVILGFTKGFGISLYNYLIGSLLTLTWNTVFVMILFVILVYCLFYYYRRELFLLTFQSELAHLESRRTVFADYIFTVLVALVTILSVQAVGILLVSALLVIPALIALQLSHSFRSTVIISIFVSVCSSVIGLILSYYADVPPSGFIVLLLLAFFVFCSLFKLLRK
jgi:zinc transport system permease protein